METMVINLSGKSKVLIDTFKPLKKKVNNNKSKIKIIKKVIIVGC